MRKSIQKTGTMHKNKLRSSILGDPRKDNFQESQYLTAWKVLLNLRPQRGPRADSMFRTFGD